MSNQHGGKREGSGRKPLSLQAMRKVCVTLTDEQVEQLRALGGGNASEGVRVALRKQGETEKLRHHAAMYAFHSTTCDAWEVEDAFCTCGYAESSVIEEN